MSAAASLQLDDGGSDIFKVRKDMITQHDPLKLTTNGSTTTLTVICH